MSNKYLLMKFLEHIYLWKYQMYITTLQLQNLLHMKEYQWYIPNVKLCSTTYRCDDRMVSILLINMKVHGRMTLLLLNFKCFEDYKNSYEWEYINGLCMQDRFSFFILCMVTLSSFSSTTNASSPLYDVMNYGAVDRKSVV